VAVVGGGNSAVDAAVCAKRRRAKDVYLLYRRSYEQMPAWPNQRQSVLGEGVHLMLLCQVVGYVADDKDRLTGVRVVRTELADAGDSGKRRPIVVENSEFVIKVDLAVEAVGKKMNPSVAAALGGVELTAGGLVKTVTDSLATTREGVWAAGDAVNGGTTVVQAVAEGRCAARQIDVHLASGEV
jgi:glutamate synthase (NADPH/NADH) small chain